jgi:hypothetical protein
VFPLFRSFVTEIPIDWFATNPLVVTPFSANRINALSVDDIDTDASGKLVNESAFSASF